MDGLLVQFLGLFALLGIVGWGYRRWIRPREVGTQGKGMLLLTIVSLVGGLVGSTGWWIDDPRSFSWDLPPLASRMLASAGWAFGVATIAALQWPDLHGLQHRGGGERGYAPNPQLGRDKDGRACETLP